MSEKMTPEDFAARANVSRETLERLQAFDALLLETAAHTNLIARSTIDDRWSRHYLDSAQLFPLLPAGARTLVDLGSGAGFPGLVLAALGADEKAGHGLSVTLVESTGKKASFLEAASSAMGLSNVTVLPQRIEAVSVAPPDAITARALSATRKLCAYVHGIAGRNTTLLFPKGAKAEEELTAALKSWRMDVSRHPSLTDENATIFEIKNLVPRGPAPR